MDGSVQASYSALSRIVWDALTPRARAQCKAWLGENSEKWQMKNLLKAWVWKQTEDGMEKDWERVQENDIPDPSPDQITEALQASGAVRRVEERQPGLEVVLKGSALENAVEGSSAHDADQLELVLLWAVTSAHQKSKLRSSVIRAAGSDTSWMSKEEKEKRKK